MNQSGNAKLARTLGNAALLAAAGLLGGCVAAGPESSDLQPAVNTTGNESDARNCARIHTELAAGYFELGNLGVALEEVRVAEQSDPTYAPVHNVAGLVYAALKDDRRAEDRKIRICAVPDVERKHKRDNRSQVHQDLGGSPSCFPRTHHNWYGRRASADRSFSLRSLRGRLDRGVGRT